MPRAVITPALIEAWRTYDRDEVERLLAQPPWEEFIFDIGPTPDSWIAASDHDDWHRIYALRCQLDHLAWPPDGIEPPAAWEL